MGTRRTFKITSAAGNWNLSTDPLQRHSKIINNSSSSNKIDDILSDLFNQTETSETNHQNFSNLWQGNSYGQREDQSIGEILFFDSIYSFQFVFL